MKYFAAADYGVRIRRPERSEVPRIRGRSGYVCPYSYLRDRHATPAMTVTESAVAKERIRMNTALRLFKIIDNELIYIAVHYRLNVAQIGRAHV